MFFFPVLPVIAVLAMLTPTPSPLALPYYCLSSHVIFGVF